MKASSSLALLVAACGLFAAAPSPGADGQEQPAAGGSAPAQATTAITDSAAAAGQSAEAAATTPGAASRSGASASDSGTDTGSAAKADGSGAGQPASQPSTAPAVAGSTKPAPDARSAAESHDPLSASVMDDGQLSAARGGAETAPVNATLNQNTTTGTVSGNVAANLTTGSNNISDSAFSNSAGVPVVIQNTGNNVLIQNSTILNLQLTAPK